MCADQPVTSLLDLRQRILVVEDIEDARTSLKHLLELSLKLEVDVAEDGEKALQMVLQWPLQPCHH